MIMRYYSLEILICFISLSFICSAQVKDNKVLFNDTIKITIDTNCEMRLISLVYKGNIDEKWDSYGYVYPYVCEQKLDFFVDGTKIETQNMKLIPKQIHTIYNDSKIEMKCIPIFEIGTLNGKRDIFYYVYGANYCMGIHCPEFFGIYFKSGAVLCEFISTSLTKEMEKSIESTLNLYGININQVDKSVSNFKLFKPIECQAVSF